MCFRKSTGYSVRAGLLGTDYHDVLCLCNSAADGLLMGVRHSLSVTLRILSIVKYTNRTSGKPRIETDVWGEGRYTLALPSYEGDRARSFGFSECGLFSWREEHDLSRRHGTPLRSLGNIAFFLFKRWIKTSTVGKRGSITSLSAPFAMMAHLQRRWNGERDSVFM